jgi:hypothetical protein
VIKQLVFLSAFLFFSLQIFAAEILVKADTIAVSGYSSISDDKLTIYGGIAGDLTNATADATYNTCPYTSGAQACNLVSVHQNLTLRISFQVTKDVSNAAVRAFIDNGSGTFTQIGPSNQTATATANNGTITIEIPWSSICANSGLNSSCSGTSTVFASRSLKVGVDSDNTGDVEDAERKTFTIKLHFIPTSASVTQNYCASTASGSGMCNLKFIPGDQKAYIDSAIYAGTDPDTGSLDWDAIAIFPVEANSKNPSYFTGFSPSTSKDPIFKTFDSSTGDIPDSSITGGLENYKLYCFIYGTRNKAQNIYRFVTDGTAADTACITPSEVVGLLEDKSCFISTAAFGSDMAPEVKTFRAFRNKFLLSNSIGRIFVKTYYKLSPPLANVIKQSEFLRGSARLALYPFLFYAQLSLNEGILAATLLFSFLILICSLLVRRVKYRKSMMILFILLLTPVVKAVETPETKTIQHEGAKEGLVRITKDGTYVYNVERSFKNESSKITLGMASQPSIDLDVTLSNNSTKTYHFGDLYSETSGLIIGYDYENFPWVDKGKLGYQIGGGAMFANGHGVLVSDGTQSAETYTFITIPINAGAVYRFEYTDKQWFAPYVAGGGTLLALLEKREDQSWPNKAGGFGFYGAGGILFNTSVLDSESGFQLDSEYGISNLWVSVEFRVTEVNSDAFSFSNQYVNAGLSFDF